MVDGSMLCSLLVMNFVYEIIVCWFGLRLCDMIVCSVSMICELIMIGLMFMCGCVVCVLCLLIWIMKLFLFVMMLFVCVVNVFVCMFGMLCVLKIVLIGKCLNSLFVIIVFVLWLCFFVGWKMKCIVLLKFLCLVSSCVVLSIIDMWLLCLYVCILFGVCDMCL